MTVHPLGGILHQSLMGFLFEFLWDCHIQIWVLTIEAKVKYFGSTGADISFNASNTPDI